VFLSLDSDGSDGPAWPRAAGRNLGQASMNSESVGTAAWPGPARCGGSEALAQSPVPSNRASG
jgi:hypothetical protein